MDKKKGLITGISIAVLLLALTFHLFRPPIRPVPAVEEKNAPATGVITLAQGPRLEVADDGPGVDPQERDAVLNRFHRGRRTLDTPGSGLGLSIVAAVARLHQFTLTLSDAKPGLVVSLDCWPRRLEA